MIIGKGLSARSIRLKLPRFTVMGTTSVLFKVDEHLKKYMFVFNLEPFNPSGLCELILIFAERNNIAIDKDTAYLLAKFSKGLPSEASKLFNNVHKYAIARPNSVVTIEVAK